MLKTTHVKNSFPVELVIPAHSEFLALAMTAMEKGAIAVGASQAEAMNLTLVVEELFAHLCRLLGHEQKIRLRLRSGLYYFRLELEAPVADIDLAAFNLTFQPDLGQADALQDLGLLIASRIADHLEISISQPHQGPKEKSKLVFSIVQERKYPGPAAQTLIEQKPEGQKWRIVEPTAELVKEIAHRLSSLKTKQPAPESFYLPGKLADMIAIGDYAAKIAVDEKQNVLGAMLWSTLTVKTVEAFGPYIFGANDSLALAQELTDAVLGALARTEALGVWLRYTTAALPAGYFEKLGEKTALSYFYRQLHEDEGTLVYADQQIKDFLDDNYRRLVLPRDVRLVKCEGEKLPLRSVICAEISRLTRTAILRPLWPGQDFLSNVRDHVQVMLKENISNLIFTIDLGQPSQAYWVPALLQNQFVPTVVLPAAGLADIVIFQHE